MEMKIDVYQIFAEINLPGGLRQIFNNGILGNSVTDRVLKLLKETEVSELWVD
jgi:hypothetical protein